MSYIDSGQGWAVDEGFYKSQRGNLCTVSGRTFYTYRDGPVIFATVYMSSTGYTGPVVLSTNRDLAAYEPGSVVTQGRFDYLSFTWYITGFTYWVTGNQPDTSGISQKLTVDKTAFAEVGIAVLKAANVVPTEYASTSTTKIYYNGNSKVIKRLCQIVNSVARLGTSHTTAFYGDLGQEAYEHSQEKGNAHDLQLADLGLENVPNQMRMILDAIGAVDSWVTYADETTYIIDHEGDNLIFKVASNLLAWH